MGHSNHRQGIGAGEAVDQLKDSPVNGTSATVFRLMSDS
jgi:hypothetical protein